MMLTLHYDGSEFHGWQLQPDQRTVQGELQAVLSRLADSPRTVLGSGRTDTGVHAVGQVASVDMPSKWTSAQLLRSLNATLPVDIWIDSVQRASSDFHPRYDAVARSYTYRVGIPRVTASPFHRGSCWALGEDLNLEILNAAAARFVGAHSFEAFAKAGQPERGYDCVIADATWTPWEFGVEFNVTADRYLHHMVRYIVGTSVDIARGRRPVQDIDLLLAGDSALTTSPPAPAEGLFLARVEYPSHVILADPTPDSTQRSTATA
ncbi:MAG: tRNA pseudouridine(38-40) synthase TruA [Gemmatimonadales bacterium]|jgi:tRNA pseudouridine38-40 synthase|nr:tRNA pseudouridine(38-40) synthase TruA [Gemmatimonadales bacterium]MBT3499066.1 tRNA pseudouridine(38-40) synthase TruA [Gemmatimonadales bacterium]MBT3774210.1 tRNA pseudouridine(38-40) synthase TruA [Gemmatimonadales bacterium]MBT3959617.1 tRNA pseudouridine(38-40) synthase TruA [Gemmatimonadales bacterium]MBT4189401.1 tRNA pseudouridine(38-40) synthase TruA [Gemmatimonadales bacterium]